MISPIERNYSCRVRTNRLDDSVLAETKQMKRTVSSAELARRLGQQDEPVIVDVLARPRR